MSTTIDDRIEDELRAAFRAAAGGVHPRVRPLPGAAPHPAARRGPGARRWLAPAVAVAAVAVIGVPLLAVSLLGTAAPDIGAASAVTVSAGRATVAGISFPLPAGWSARTVGSTDTSVTVCIAATPSTSCAGVALRIAVPDGDGNITPVPDPVTLAEVGCPGDGKKVAALYPQIVDHAPLGGRPAAQFAIGCGPTGPRSAGWYVTDGSLTVTTPPAVALAQGTTITAGLDFTGYHHEYGPQHMFFSEPGVASYPGPTPPTR
jgi:hypothetical protein